MLIWKVWRALHYPAANRPVYRYFSRRTPRTGRRTILWFVPGYWVSCCIIAYGSSLAGLAVLNGIGPALLLILVITAIVFYGANIASSLGSIIAQEHLRRRFELLCLLPDGPLRIHWTISTARLHSTRTFLWLDFASRVLVISLLLALGVGFVILYAMTARGVVNTYERALQIMDALLLTAGLYYGYIEAVVAGTLTGLTAPSASGSPTEIRLNTLGIFLLSQMAIYLFTWLAGFLLLPIVYGLLSSDAWLAPIGLSALRLLIFCAAGEVSIRLLWRILTRRLNAAPSELDAVLFPTL
jgi:hypothetical protein